MESRQSRMNKYYDESVEEEIVNSRSRSKRNQELYKEVKAIELEDFDLNSNASVIGNNTDNINLDEIKDILNKRYNEGTRKKSFGDTEEINLPKINLDETREYDLNSILSKAKSEKQANYEEDRLKKIRNTQYDILKNLSIMNKDDEIEEEDLDNIVPVKKERAKAEVGSAKTKEDLVDLIDTISAKELIRQEENLKVTGEMDPLDILSDLRGDDDATKVMGMLAQEIEEAEKENARGFKNEDTLGILSSVDEEEDISKEEETGTLEIENEDEIDDEDEDSDDTNEVTITKVDLESFTEEIETKKDKKEKKSKNNLYDSFIGKTTTFTQSDFDDFDDLKNDMKFTKVIVKILIFLIVVLFIVGVVIILNKHLGWGLF